MTKPCSSFAIALEYYKRATAGTALTLLAAVCLIVPISWVYLRYKAGVPPGM